MATQNTNLELGFTLIEMSIVIIFFGLFAGLFLNFFLIYQNQVRTQVTDESLSQTQIAINSFKGLQGRYPCPADPRLGPDDAGYGEEDCTGASLPANPATVDSDNLVELDQDAAVRNPEQIMAGAVPFKTIESALGAFDDAQIAANNSPLFASIASQAIEKMSVDGYGNKLTYIVTRELADPNYPNPAHTFDEKRGAIVIVDENTVIDGTFFQDLNPAQERMAHFIVISHGPDGRGAYTREGQVVEACIIVSALPPPPGIPPPPPPADQKENCDVSSTDEMDAAFINGITNTLDDRYYDDKILITEYSLNDLWGADFGSSVIFPLNVGNVGVGTDDPQFKLHVEGGNLQTNSMFKAPQICDETGANCMQAESIAGSVDNMRCPKAGDDPNAKVIMGISNNEVICAIPNIVSINDTCPSGQLMRGVTISTGSAVPICVVP